MFIRERQQPRVEESSESGTHLVKTSPHRQSVISETVTGVFYGKALVAEGVKRPLVPFQVVRIGGHRTLGGGTSDEAIRRARRKSAANGHF